tara:strand:+ start:413 stop:2497 length:2085 start_codon:yes stop_codon:yes gene_type:complete
MKLSDLYKYSGIICFISLGFFFNQENLLASCNKKNCSIENKYLFHKKLSGEKLVLQKLLANLFLETEKNDNQSETSKNSFDIDSDIQYFEGDIFYAEGNVVVKISNGIIRADKISYDQVNKIFIAENDITFNKGNQYIQAKYAQFNLKKSEGFLNEVYGALDFANIEEDLNITEENNNFDFCEADNSDLINLPSEVSLLGSNNLRFRNKIGVDSFSINFSVIDKWRFKSDKIIIDNKQLKSELIYFTNDPFNKPQFVLRSKNFSAEIVKNKTQYKSKRTSIIFDNKITLPIGSRTIDKNSFDLRWGLGYESKDKDGLFVIRNFDPLKIADNLKVDFQPYFLFQRSLLGESNAFRLKDSSVLSENEKININFWDYFALNKKVEGNLLGWNLNINTDLKTINPDRFYDAFSYDLSLMRNLYRSNNISNNFSQKCYESRSLTQKSNNFNVDLGIYSAFDKDNIYTANGFKLINSYNYSDKKLEKKYLLTFDVGTYKGESNSNKNYLNSLDRYGLTTTFENNFEILNKKKNVENITKDYNYYPEIINQGIKIRTKLGYGIFNYSDDSSQSIISASVGPEFTYGNFKNKFFDYSVLSIMPEYISKNGRSPFEFDDFEESSRILFGIKQQIYGPLLLSFSTSYNVDNNSKDFGVFENKKLSLGVSRRAYSFGLVYDEDQKSIGLEFNVFNFGYNKNASKF